MFFEFNSYSGLDIKISRASAAPTLTNQSFVGRINDSLMIMAKKAKITIPSNKELANIMRQIHNYHLEMVSKVTTVCACLPKTEESKPALKCLPKGTQSNMTANT